MALILCIETSATICSIALSEKGVILCKVEDYEANSHSRIILQLIEKVFFKTNYLLKDIDAVAINGGPGSYTGLRIGVSTAKGICYGLNKQLIVVNALDAMVDGFVDENKNMIDKKTLLVPMIDARRMEVYSQVNDSNKNIISTVKAKIIDNKTFTNLSVTNKIILFGSGADKFVDFFNIKNITIIENFKQSATYLANIAEQKYNANDFADLAYFEPFYLKDFVAGKSNVKGLV